MPIAASTVAKTASAPANVVDEPIEKDVLLRLLGHRQELHDRQVRIVPRQHLLDGRAQLARRELAAQGRNFAAPMNGAASRSMNTCGGMSCLTSLVFRDRARRPTHLNIQLPNRSPNRRLPNADSPSASRATKRSLRTAATRRGPLRNGARTPHPTRAASRRHGKKVRADVVHGRVHVLARARLIALDVDTAVPVTVVQQR